MNTTLAEKILYPLASITFIAAFVLSIVAH